MPDGSELENITSVLITGGSGLIGKYLTSRLLSEGYKVSHLSRKPGSEGKVRSFHWDPEKGIIDPAALTGVDCIVHLAGANLGEKRWTKKRKREIIDSRVESARLLFHEIQYQKTGVKAFISASAVGIYGAVTTGKVFTETDIAASDFTGEVCRKWEEAADMFASAGIRTVKLRTPPVMERNDSALTKMLIPAKFGFLVKTKGSQYMPWIHVSDITGIYMKAVTDATMKGVYNAVAPEHVTHQEFMKTLGAILHKPVIPMPFAESVLKAVFGEMADIILEGSRVSDEKIISAGYNFRFDTLKDALSDIFNHASK
jgi:uncharacterized protein